MKLQRTSVQRLVGVLILALLLVQLIGVTHGVVHGVHGVHGNGPGSAHGPHTHEAHDPAHQHAGPLEADELEALFSAHQEDQEGCRLFDQACHSLPLSALPTLSLPLALFSQVLDISRSRALARWAALFQARGPPLFR